HIEWLRKRDPNREPTVGDLGQLVSKRHPRLVGTPEQIADALALWQQAGIDGVNLINWIIPGSYQEFNAHLLPELQRRGLAKREYAPGTLRRKLFGRDRLDERHPGARWRGAFARSFAAE
ncbi:MAG: LLM class flavin-dependent oxidoreductase, partial [Bradyrhizobium sp.]